MSGYLSRLIERAGGPSEAGLAPAATRGSPVEDPFEREAPASAVPIAAPTREPAVPFAPPASSRGPQELTWSPAVLPAAAPPTAPASRVAAEAVPSPDVSTPLGPPATLAPVPAPLAPPAAPHAPATAPALAAPVTVGLVPPLTPEVEAR